MQIRGATGRDEAREAGDTLRYGYIVIGTTASSGFPATIRRIVYEGTAITVPNFCGVNATIVSILDIDGDCIVDPLTDGLLLTRAMLGLTGTAVTNNATGANATRTCGLEFASISTSNSWRTVCRRSLTRGSAPVRIQPVAYGHMARCAPHTFCTVERLQAANA